ncbi:prolipoprotein diacylglyceryl transferase [Blattabacterium cuenoti]|uniref:prolipoprotein diacylglyceryl transferase n=1 Tax=Blattabacterium cuenoti TaxID=1653831 RepID=UPI00163C5986|nr:prolipoprotein diacylglyceryl transferase [Blattabacterium cuenoti]
MYINVLEYINWNPIHRFHIWKGFFIHIYSLMFIISFLLGWWIMQYIYQNDNINKKYLDPLFRYTFFGTIIGSRLGQIFFYDFLYFSNHWIESVLPIRKNNGNYFLGIIKNYEYVGYRGLSSHGAAIGIIIAVFFYKKKFLKKKPFIWLCDRLVIVAAISSMFIRIGNFFNSEIIGIPTKLPWAVKFIQMEDKRYNLMIPRHPTQIYESIVYLILFVILWFFYYIFCKKKILKNGFLSGLFLIITWGSRFLIEFIKEPQENEFIHFYILNTGQCLSIPFIILGFYIIFITKNQSLKSKIFIINKFYF